MRTLTKTILASSLALCALTAAQANYYNCVSSTNLFHVSIVTDELGNKACGWKVMTGAQPTAPVGSYNPTVVALGQPGEIITTEIPNPTIQRCTPVSLTQPSEMQFQGGTLECWFAPRGSLSQVQPLSADIDGKYQLEAYENGHWSAVTDGPVCPKDNNQYCRVAPKS